MKDELKITYNKKDGLNSIGTGSNIDSWDINLLYYFLHYLSYNGQNTLIEELIDRGYDLDTLEFSITKLASDSSDLKQTVCHPSIRFNTDDLIDHQLASTGLKLVNRTKDEIVITDRWESGGKIIYKYNTKTNHWGLGIHTDILDKYKLNMIYTILESLNREVDSNV